MDDDVQRTREVQSDIDALVVDAGLRELYAALECYRQGHSPPVIKNKNEIDRLGQCAFARTRIWTVLTEQKTGDFVGIEPSVTSQLINGQECRKHTAASSTGDVVVAADGMGSKVEKVMIGKQAKAISSGFSVYTVTYPTELLQPDPFLAKRYPLPDGGPDHYEVYVSPKVQMIILISPQLTTWVFTHKVRILNYVQNEGQAEESWSMRLSASDALETLRQIAPEWDAKVSSVIEKTPPSTVVDCGITWRDPEPV